MCCVTAGCDIASPEKFSTATSVSFQAGGPVKPVSAGMLACKHIISHLVDTDFRNLSDCRTHPPLCDAFSCDFWMDASVILDQPLLLLQATAGPHALQSPEGHRCRLSARAARMPALRLGRAAACPRMRTAQAAPGQPPAPCA